MIGKNTLKVYGYNSINEYWNMIYNSLLNGQIRQTKEYIAKMNKSQKREFMYFFIWDLSDSKIKNGLLQFLIEDLTK